MIKRKSKRRIICFFVIISLFLSLIFPSFTKAEDSKDKNNVYDDFSIQVDTTSCVEELIVKLGNTNLFCVQNTARKLPDEKDINYWKKEKEILGFDAKIFTNKINKFANTKKNYEDLKIDLPNCKNLDDCLQKSPDKNYYYFRIIYPEKPHEYFGEMYNTEIIKIGLNFDFDVKEKWDKIRPELECKREEVRENIKIAIKDYRNSFKSALNQDSRKKQICNKVTNQLKDLEDTKPDKQQPSSEEQKSLEVQALQKEVQKLQKEVQALPKVLAEQISEKEQEKLTLSKQAVRHPGHEPIFYIRAWNKGLSPSERAQRVNENIDKIIKGKIDIQGIGIFEQSTENIENKNIENNGSTNEQSKIIKIISDSKFLSEDEKKIMEVTFQDALLAGEDNAANLAQKYLVRIDKLVDEHKSGTDKIEKRGYPVTFLKDPLFSINSGLGATESGSNLYQASHRASKISDRIKKFAQENLILNPNRLVAAYPVGKGLCILPESLKSEDYKNFLASSNRDKKNKTNCKVEDLVKKGNLSIIYSDEITEKINRGDWQLTNTDTKSIKYLSEEVPQSIIFMELNQEHEHLMNIQFTELDHILHKEFETKQELAIYFLNQIKDKVTTYTSRKRIWLIICIVLLLIVLQMIFRIHSSIQKIFSATRRILFEDVSVIFQELNLFLSEKIIKIVNILNPDNKTLFSKFLKLVLFILIVIFAISNVPKINFLIIDFRGILSRFLEDQKNIIFSYIYTKLPLLFLIIISAYILDQAVIVFASKNLENIKDNGKKAKFKSLLVIFRVLLVIFTFIFITPYLPAAGTIYFKAISGFAVLAFTWSASSVISDFVSGIILIHFTSLKKGDWIEVGGTMGKIINQNLIFHKLKTSKKWVKTIPNSFILNNCTANLSLSCQKGAKIILHVPVGLGYDVPRELVEITLIDAALKTKNVVRDIPDYDPFVLITNLGDFAVSYELNVYTGNPAQITTIYSDLQKNIQDQCDLRGIEILSPNYSTLRFDTEGTATT